MNKVPNQPQTRFGREWATWAAISAGGFAALEGYTLLKHNPHGTLSVHLRKVLGIQPNKRHRHVGRVVFVGGCAWLAWHIALCENRWEELEEQIWALREGV